MHILGLKYWFSFVVFLSFSIGFLIDANAIGLWHEQPSKMNTSFVALQVSKEIEAYNLEEELFSFAHLNNIVPTNIAIFSSKSVSWKKTKEKSIQKIKTLSLKLHESQDEFAFISEIIPFYQSISLLNNKYGYGIGFKLFD